MLSACVACIIVFAAWGCAPAPVGRGGSEACGRLDSLYASGGFEQPVSITGQATVDANQYKVRGKIRVDAAAPGEVVIEFTSTVLFGHAREDVVFSSVGDTLRIVDRERGAYYEGSEAESFLAGSFETDLDIGRVLLLALGGHPPCDELSGVHFATRVDGGIHCTGRHLGDRFLAVFGAGRRLERIEWPVRSDIHGKDRLRADYEWEAGPDGVMRLQGLVVSLERREWRCKIQSGG